MLLRWIVNHFGRRKNRRAEAGRLVSEATALLGRRDVAAARSCIEEALAIAPRDAAVLHLAGVIHCGQGDYATGLGMLREGLRRDRRNIDLHWDYANALRSSADVDGAEVEYRRLIDASPRPVRVRNALGRLLLDTKRPAEALAEFEQVLAIAPEDVEAQKGLALACYRLLNFRRACELYAALYDKGVLDIYERNNFGSVLLYAGQPDAACKILAGALALAEEGTQTHSIITRNLAFSYLGAGDWATGLRLHERRHEVKEDNESPPDRVVWLDFVAEVLAGMPPWRDGGCRGKRVLVWVEQGHGDVIMLLRLLPVLLDDFGAAAVALLCPPGYGPMEAGCERTPFLLADPSWKSVPGQYDVHCSIMSLPYLMGLRPDSIPGKVPYFRVPEARKARWRDDVAALPGLKVGVVWAGNPKMPQDALRSVALDMLEPLFAVPGVSFVSLQKGDAAQEELRQRRLPMVDWMDRCGDFMETAALMDNLDLIIAIDTGVAHLAGAMGKTVWLLHWFEGDWRWVRGREDSVWYPSMRLFSQTESRKWRPVIDRVLIELRLLAAGRPA